PAAAASLDRDRRHDLCVYTAEEVSDRPVGGWTPADLELKTRHRLSLAGRHAGRTTRSAQPVLRGAIASERICSTAPCWAGCRGRHWFSVPAPSSRIAVLVGDRGQLRLCAQHRLVRRRAPT